jgi:cytochrome o ubiquinol oxidase subunit 3
MTHSLEYPAEHGHHDTDNTDVLGFWMYIMTDCVLFATLFAGFAVLHNNTYGGPPLKQLINLPYVLGETLFLLFSNLTFGFAILTMYKKKHSQLIGWLVVTMILGLGFVLMEVHEFMELAREGHGWYTSGAMSSFYTLVGTHGLHVSFGLFWMLILTIQLSIFKISPTMRRRLTYLGLFWNFLDIVWIFVFTVVYLIPSI